MSASSTRSALKPIWRADVLAPVANAGKAAKVDALLARWRQVAPRMAAEQWRLFFETGRFNALHGAQTALGLLGTAHRQMVRRQVVGMLQSWVANRQNDFKSAVQNAHLSAELRHQLHTINSLKAWYVPGDIALRSGAVIPADVRRLARRIFAGVCQPHRRPSFRRINAVIDRRAVRLEKAKTSRAFPHWVRLSTLEAGQPLWLPIAHQPRFEARTGAHSLTLQVNSGEAGLRLVVLTDVAADFAQSRAAYAPRCAAIALDLGLVNLFATDGGDILGRDWLAKLKDYDRQISSLAAYRQRHGLKTRSPRYRQCVARFRGYLQTRIGQVLNTLVATRAPAEIVLEGLDFRAPELSRRMNRLLGLYGRRFIDQKLLDLEQRLGITITRVHAAYSSQQCAGCGYVDPKNRISRDRFVCRACGRSRHADANAARILGQRRSLPVFRNLKQHRHDILRILVRQYPERAAGRSATATDRIALNPYFQRFRAVPDVKAEGVDSRKASTAFCT